MLLSTEAVLLDILRAAESRLAMAGSGKEPDILAAAPPPPR